MPLLRSLTGKTLLRLALSGTVLLLLATALGAYFLYRQAERQATGALAAEASERARVATQVFRYTVETHVALRQAFIQQWPAYRTPQVLQRFEALMARYPDGSMRSRREIADGRRFPTGWIAREHEVDDELRQRMVLFHDLSQRYGPGAALRHDNLYFVGLPQQSNMGYDPELFPDWIFDIGDHYDQLQFDWGRTAYAPARPGDGPRFSTPEVDDVDPRHGATFAVVTPIHLGERHVAAVCTTLRLSDVLSRVLPPSPRARQLIFHRNGRLIADTARYDSALPSLERVQLQPAGDGLEATLLALVQRPGGAVPWRFSHADDLYVAVSAIEGPDWYVAATVPGSVVRSGAMRTAMWALWLGAAALLALLSTVWVVLRNHVAVPLGALTRAAERLAAGDTAVRLPDGRADELGRLSAAFNQMVSQVALRDASLRADKQQIEEALTAVRLTEERWRAMTDNASDFIAVVDEQGRFRYASPSVQRMLGVSPQALLGRPALDLVPPDEAQRLQARLAAPTGGPVEFRARHADGGLRVLEAVSSDMRAHPAVQGLVLNIRDVTQAVDAEREIAHQRETLHQREKLSALGSLLAGVAHELNNPLTVVIGRARQLQDTTPDTQTQEAAGKICQAAERCSRIVKTFLAMARREAPRRAPVDVNRVVTDALDLLAYNLRSSGVAVQTRLAPGLPPVMADASQLGQVLVNLLTNAQQALQGRGDPLVRIITRWADGSVWVEVADNGPGVPAALAPRVFEPFFTTKGVGEGTGVGLSVSLAIVQAHGGHLRLEASPQGARFVMRLPAGATLAAQAPALPATAEAPQPQATPQVLVVDDEPEIAQLLAEILGAGGCQVQVAHDGQEALALLAHHPVDVVLTDFKMPGLDGAGLHAEILRRQPRLARRVIVVTGDTLSSESQAFLRTSGLRVLDKPFRKDDVLRAVREVGALASPGVGMEESAPTPH
ncbi:ATP-binding protein [Aquincola tertiaricarbonis]|uniref:ATP-binding protein n=1 Tax=Aquincola tertiaricarbonis TaxID=391953 RepID=UPI00069864BA|nr:ATP-binding protein [Aquincola tertiaricarbonis]